MSSNEEQIKFLIDAEDRATKKVRAVTTDIKTQVSAVQDVGKGAKASTELVGSLAQTMGGTQFGSFAGQMAQMTERVSAFGEVAKQSATAATAFKVALVGGVAVAAVTAGREIGKLIFTTKDLNKEFGFISEQVDRMTGIVADKISDAKFEMSLVDDPEKKQAMLAALTGEVKGLTDGAEQAAIAAANEKRAIDAASQGRVGYGDKIKAADQKLENARATVKSYTATLKDLQRELEQTGRVNKKNRLESIISTAATNEAARQKKIADEKKKQLQAEALAIKNKEQAEKAELARVKRLTDFRNQQINAVKLQVVAMKEGEQAAEAMRLQQAGVDETTAKRLAKIRAHLDKENDTGQVAGRTTLGTSDQRLLSGRGESQGNKLLSETSKQTKTAERSEKLLEKMEAALAQMAKQQPFQVAVVGD